MKIRVKFAKVGVVKFIGHLDIMRYFQKAIRRSEIDVIYSSGYSPHQIMSFAAPLGVGLESQGEYMDIEVNTRTSSEDLKEKLNAVMTQGMMILDVRELEDNACNAMASVAAAKYKVTFRKGYEPNFDWKSQLEKFYDRDSILVIKQTKKSEKELDLKPSIYSLEIVNDGIEMMVDASSAGNIKPTLVLGAFYKENGFELGEFDLEITRLDTYGCIGKQEEHNFIPLSEFGKLF